MRPRLTLSSFLFFLILPVALVGQEFPTLATDASAGTGEIQPCEIRGTEVRCGTYRVWEDRTARSGRTIDLAFAVVPAEGQTEPTRDAIVLLPGGPGQALIGAAPGMARRTHFRSRDVLLVDVRGVGRSQGLSCPDFEIDVQDRFGTVFPRQHIQMCRDALAERASLDLYTTNLSVDDIEELRTWLGYEAVNLTGGSYGTRVAQVYMRRHPEAIRTVVLNSVAPVFVLGYVHMAQSLQRSLDLVVTDCLSETECSASHPELREQLDGVLARFARGPVEVEVNGSLVDFTMGDFAYALRGLLYGGAQAVPEIIRLASEGDFDRVSSYYLQRAGWVGGQGGEAGYHFSALCGEDILPLTDAMVEEASEGTFMGDHLIAGYREVCDVWGVTPLPDSFWEPVRSDLPVLIISGEFDPVTPPAWGDAVAEHLPNSVHVVVPGGGHGPGNACTNSLEARLLEDASVAGLDPSCMQSSGGAGG
ncbi:MAG: alpha/beta hydrolase [Gemmatimonadota bacterium]|nr:alpha/beta hydrolase [Gemmatimonadota bacterium]